MTLGDGTRAPRWAITLLAVVAGGVVALGPATATAEASGSCDGVWVVVDARELGGSLTTRCAPGDPSSGLRALESAGHTYAFVPRVPGMVCTIDRRPDPCNGAPEDAYWSYWYAEAGGQWTYSSRGAGSRDPAPGTVEGWAFGAGAPPGTAPPAAPADDGTSEATSDDDPDSSGASDPDASGSGPSGSGDTGSSTPSASADGSTSAGSSGSPSDPGTDGAADAPADGADVPADDAATAEAGDAEEARDDETGAEPEPDEATDAADRAGAGARAADVLAGRGTDGDTDARREREVTDEVTIGGPDEGRGTWAGVAAGTALAGALAGAAALRVRRRTSLDR